MTIGYIKGYDIITISKKNVEKIEMGSKLANGEEIKQQIKEALSNGGAVYALRRKKELFACYIFNKRECAADEIMNAGEAAKFKGESIRILELAHEYRTHDVEDIEAKIKRDLLSVLGEKISFCKCNVLVWGEEYYTTMLSRHNVNYVSYLIIAVLLFAALFALDKGYIILLFFCMLLPSFRGKSCGKVSNKNAVNEVH